MKQKSKSYKNKLKYCQKKNKMQQLQKKKNRKN